MSRRSGNRRLGALPLLALSLIAACSPRNAPRPSVAAEPIADDGTRVSVVAAEPGVVTPPPVVVPELAMVSYLSIIDAMERGNRDEARPALEQMIREFPDLPGPYVNLAIIYRLDGMDDDAYETLQRALEIAPYHAAANNEIGVLLRERGEFAAAEAAYRRALETDSGYALAHYNLGVLLELYLRREAEALQEYEAFQALAREPDPAVGRWIVDLRRRLGLPAATEQLARETG